MYGLEIKIDPWKEMNTDSSVVIYRSSERYVRELTLDYVDSMRVDQQNGSSARPGAWTMQPITSSSFRNDAPISMEQRTWEHKPACDEPM